MGKNELFSKYSLEDILAEARLTSGDGDERLWSLAEIDTLLEKTAPERPEKRAAEEKGSAEEAASEDKKPEKPLGLKETAILQAKREQAVRERLKGFPEVLPENPLVEGTVPARTEPEKPEEQEEPEAAVSDEQLTIEKTRLFNEVEEHAVRCEQVEHQIGRRLTHTRPDQKGGGMETDKYRERFLREPKLNVENTLDHQKLMESQPPKTFEKYGVIVRQNAGDKTGEDGLKPVPTIVSAEDELRVLRERWEEAQAEILAFGKTPAQGSEEEMEQIRLEGFEPDSPPEQVDEYEAERELLEKRRERAKRFRLFGEQSPAEQDGAPAAAGNSETAEEKTNRQRQREKSGTEEVRVAREYHSYRDAQAVYDALLSERKKASFRLIVFSVLLAVLISASAAVSYRGSYDLFGGSVFAFLGLELFCLLLAAVMEFREFGRCFSELRKKKATRSSAIAAALFFGALQCAAAFGFPEPVGGGMHVHIYAPLAFFLLLLVAAGDWTKAKNDMRSFEYLTVRSKSLYSVAKVEDENEAFEIGRGLLLGDPDVRYSARIAFPSDFVALSRKSVPEDKIFDLALPTALIAALLVGGVTLFAAGSLFAALTAMTGIVFFGLPFAAVLSSADILNRANKVLGREKSLISGYSAVEDAVKANAVAVDASDMFLASGCVLYGFKLFNSMRVDDAILYTAAVIIQSGGTLTQVFDWIILSKREILPPVESLTYEEKLGCSGWIHNQRVLVGNRLLLSKHNVEVPDEETEAKFCRDGRQVLYLAVEGRTAAMFVVGYTANQKTAKYLRRLEKCGVSILVRTSDPNITETLIEQYFDLPKNFVKIINPVAGKILKSLYETEKPSDPCRIIHDGRIVTLLRAFTSAFAVQERLRISAVLQYIGIGIGILVGASLSFASAFSQAGFPQLLCFEALWTAFVLLAARLKKI